ncbi:hypothetical protein [Saccharothrix sp. ST-888]|uniref:hypothetical protein n=1 Tax=Saccharothrix sp. ST-888 TaxID=1427391 RepID=UPI0005ECAA9C|nr:hypothetical protein [Saccharothrix sp. ST-888]KJK56233.1 hypothetical protein UK12_23920 [Saccharothrix sp. ST-888]
MTHEHQEEQPSTVETAFLVFKRGSEWEATPHYQMPLDVQRSATVADMHHGACEVVSDIKASKIAAMTAQLVIQQQMQLAAAAREHAANDAVRTKLLLPK